MTRPVGKGKDTFRLVKSLGWKPFIFHTVELRPLAEWKIKDQIQDCLDQGPIDWIVFMSSTGVRLLFHSVTSNPDQREFLDKTSFLAVGPKTKDALTRHRITRAFVPDRYSSAGVDEFFSRLGPGNQRIVLVRSSSADDFLANSLASKGATVTTVNVYESLLPRNPGSAFRFLEGLRAGHFSAVLFTSAISASNFFKIVETELEEEDVRALMRQLAVGAVGPVTAEELRKHGLDPIVPDEYLIEKALKKLISKQ